ncbi:DEAD/DEAH box helicase [Photobacterium iliopiscarium]|uniref:DEAD/DEAH box helicase n=1 Tax=Photobacterium iliopiscarium TaxID=56192 RepID=UPI0005D437EC|nr:DEAD/DEAH box helicase family protein [Photobacterium iliopiscarium]KJG14536.1 diguanylate cyclase [Photobacterium iliopiscarium]PST99292.1 diguanylate cyclase [Photobacterium iliopiscarium]PSV84934.1 diguanylate cyclase [Photobacterium iliopiscarium]USN27415.1 diguanylate cyclase [synthetic construct]
MLRLWQSECISNAIDHYKNGNYHFLAQATPGAGKTLMAAYLAKALFDSNMIDLVICFSPSRTVALDIQKTFADVLDCIFNGQVATLGCSMTYQSMQYLHRDFWKTISRRRVLCVFDEIHHCGGDEDSDSNSWGQSLVHDIQHAALYTLALTGTPWRSDKLPISLLSYTDPEGKVICNYQYSLKQAVNDGVCRRPNITLIDSDKISLQSDTKPEHFNSINALLENSSANYSCILNNNNALNAIIELAVNKLETIRQISAKAGGLIVAASIIHAQKIIQVLKQQFDQTCVLVTYKDKHSNSIIESFKHSATQWIVSIGMISEGTDIPRLQVCCHLSNIRTELYFRQVLGRILRTTNTTNQEAWLYTFAESNLVLFAEQIEIDIPESCSRITMFNDSYYSERDQEHTQYSTNIDNKVEDHCYTIDWESNENTFISEGVDIQTQHSALTLGQYHTRVISAFVYV